MIFQKNIKYQNLSTRIAIYFYARFWNVNKMYQKKYRVFGLVNGLERLWKRGRNQS